MRELVARLQFTKHCLGDVKRQRRYPGGKCTFFQLPRTPNGRLAFLPSWWRANMAFAAEVFGRLQDVAKLICFESEVGGDSPPEKLYRRYYAEDRFALHEALWPGQQIEVRLVCPPAITDDELRELLAIAGRFRGISPAKPKEFGFFTVATLGAVAREAPEVELKKEP